MPPKDKFVSDDLLIGSARIAEAITPSDDDDLAWTTKAIYCGSDGDIVLTAVDSTSSTTFSVLQGTILPIRAKKVHSTSTTVTQIIGLR